MLTKTTTTVKIIALIREVEQKKVTLIANKDLHYRIDQTTAKTQTVPIFNVIIATNTTQGVFVAYPKLTNIGNLGTKAIKLKRRQP